MVDLSTLQVNDKISFTTIDPRDNNTYTATVVGICSYDMAKSFTDLLPTYESVKKAVPTMSPIDELSYFLFQHVQQGITSTFAMAKEWIEPTSVIKIDYTKTFDIRIYDRYTEEDKKNVKQLLNAHGFKCAILED